MKALIALARQDLILVVRSNFALVMAIVLVLSAGTVIAARALGAGAEAASPAGLDFAGRVWAVEVVGGDGGRDVAGRLLEALLAFEALVLGFLFVSVGVFEERREATVRAYRISPGGIARWISAKLLLWTALSLAYVVLMLAMSLSFGHFALHLLVALPGALLMTELGLAVAVWFNSISEWFLPGVAILIVNMIPMFAGQNIGEPLGVAPRIIPGALALAGFRAAASGDSAGAASAALSLAIGCAALAAPLFAAVRRALFSERRR